MLVGEPRFRRDEPRSHWPVSTRAGIALSGTPFPGGRLSSNTASVPPSTNRIGFLAQAFRFGLVGICGAVVDYSSLMLQVWLGVWPELARAISFMIGSTFAYLVNRRWTFTSHRNFREVVTWAIVLGSTFLLVTGGNALLLRLLPDSPWRITLAWAISQGIATTFNFLAQRKFVFRH